MGIALAKQQDHAAIARVVAMRVITLVQRNPQAVIGLATGSTPEPVYAEIIAQCEAAKAAGRPIDFSQATFFALDEYIGLPPEHPQSYHHYLWSKLLDPIGADPARVHLPDGMADPAQACADYEAALQKAGKVDLWILGIGRNGHIAFNEPGTAFDSRTHRVALTDSTLHANRPHFSPGETQPTEAITVGLGTLRDHTREALLLANGQGKAKIMAKLLHGGVGPQVPASLLKTSKMKTTLYADREALGMYEGLAR